MLKREWLLFVPFLLLALTTPSFAADEAVAISENGMVYREANFDSPVIGYLKAGQKYYVSTRKFNTAFHRIRLKQGVLGYVADTDISTGKEARKDPRSFKDEDSNQNARDKSPDRPIFMRERTLLGLTYGYVQYAEVFAKTEYRSPTSFLGAKLTTPFGLIDGPFLFDLQFSAALEVPAFFKSFSQTPPTGNILLGHIMIIYPLHEFSGRRGLFYIGAGPAVAYSSILVEYQNSKLALDEVRAGAVITTGLAFDLFNSKLVIKFEPKYYVEKSNYASYEAVLQFGF